MAVATAARSRVFISYMILTIKNYQYTKFYDNLNNIATNRSTISNIYTSQQKKPIFDFRGIYLNSGISHHQLITSPPIGGGRGIVMPMSVCVCVCLCVCLFVCLFVRVFAKFQSVISQPFLNRSL